MSNYMQELISPKGVVRKQSYNKIQHVNMNHVIGIIKINFSEIIILANPLTNDNPGLDLKLEALAFSDLRTNYQLSSLAEECTNLKCVDITKSCDFLDEIIRSSDRISEIGFSTAGFEIGFRTYGINLKYTDLELARKYVKLLTNNKPRLIG